MTRVGPGSSSGRIFTERRLDLLPGHNELLIQLPPLHSLRVSAPNLDSGTNLQLFSAPEATAEPIHVSFSAKVSTERTALFPPLPAGLYRLTGPGGSMRVRLPSPEVTFEPTGEADGVYLVLMPGDPALAEAGLQHGDRLLSCNGELLTPSNYLRICTELRGATEGLWEFRLRRSGQTLERSVDASLGGKNGLLFGAQTQFVLGLTSEP